MSKCLHWQCNLIDGYYLFSVHFFMVVSRIIHSLISYFAHLKWWKTLVVQSYIWVFYSVLLYYKEFNQAYPSLIGEESIWSVIMWQWQLPSWVGKVFWYSNKLSIDSLVCRILLSSNDFLLLVSISFYKILFLIRVIFNHSNCSCHSIWKGRVFFCSKALEFYFQRNGNFYNSLGVFFI